ncbi:hypothetical protein Poly51_27900 [Rubripirellula tenax]|uniref:Glycosyl transferases group 1 n=1 Tax=Rubripirellula tenax TaxID=2528015 RepID=A0A5C6F7C4_9BACT|nr:glycosyltransferase [Rubripirellula tenax]TWU56872.1 hypothetical protein Poly51_27900 [Rubripirellula tenax]
MFSSPQTIGQCDASDALHVVPSQHWIGVIEGPVDRDEACLFHCESPHDGFIHRPLRTVPVNRLGRQGRFWSFAHLLPESLSQSVDLVHAVNTVPLNAKRFVIALDGQPAMQDAFASSWHAVLGHRLLRLTSCRRILVRSEIAKRNLRGQFELLGLSELADKLSVFRGFVPELARDAKGQSAETRMRRRAARRGDSLQVMFVGHDAIGMGVIPMLDALETLRRGGLEIRLTLVSRMDAPKSQDLASRSPSIEKVRDRVDSAPWIRRLATVSRRRVQELAACHDVLVLPALSHTSGWQIAEAAMQCCPAISTNLFSLPELIESNDTGMLMELPIDGHGQWEGFSLDSERKKNDAIVQTTRSVSEQLTVLLSILSQNRDRVDQLGIAARDKMRSLFGRTAAVGHLQQVYADACG